MKKLLRRLMILLVVLLIALQFVPAEQSNPPVEASIEAEAPVLAILRRACFDCHSNETPWPWYSKIAPFSLLVSHDVEEGREEMNFSSWGKLDKEERAHLKEEIWEEVEEGEMPLWFYLPLHSEAKLSDADLKVLEAWSKTPTK